MSIDPRNVAVQGIGYGPLSVATMGFLGVRVEVSVKRGGPWPEGKGPFGKKPGIEEICIKVYYHGKVVADTKYVIENEFIKVTAKFIEAIYDNIKVRVSKISRKILEPIVRVRLK